MIRHLFPVLLACGLSACATSGLPARGDSAPVRGPLSAQIVTRTQPGPPSTIPGQCWAHDMLPAEVETITQHRLIAPAHPATPGPGALPPEYRTVTRQRIVRPRKDIWFRSPCPAAMTPDRIATLQRALEARGLYRGQITGQMNAQTHQALRRYQAPLGLDSGKLSLITAQWLGVLAYKFYGGKLHTG